jgi:hypothetical protein
MAQFGHSGGVGGAEVARAEDGASHKMRIPVRCEQTAI